MIEQTFVEVLAGDSSVTEICDQRIYPMTIPQDVELPAVVFQRVSTTPTTSVDGDTELDNVRLEVSCYAPTLLEAKQLSVAVRAAVNASDMSAVPVMMIDMQDPETKSYRTIVDFNIWQRGAS